MNEIVQFPLRARFEQLRTDEASFLRALDMASDELDAALEANAALQGELERLRAPWQLPPEAELPDGYRCLGLVQTVPDCTLWKIVVWRRSQGDWFAEGNWSVTPLTFAPLP